MADQFPNHVSLLRPGPLYRAIATGVWFVLFMGVSLLIGLIWLPILKILPLGKLKRAATIRRTIAFLFNTFIHAINFIRLADVRFKGQLPVDGGPYLVVANHPTLIDVCAILGRHPQLNCVVKGALWQHPYMGLPIRDAGYVPNNSGPYFITAAQQNFDRGQSLLLFPEGTRSQPGGLNPFSRGAAQIALRCNVPIVPIHVTCRFPVLYKGCPWYRQNSQKMQLHFEFLEPIDLSQKVPQDAPLPTQARQATRFLESFYKTTTKLDSRSRETDTSSNSKD